MLYSELVKYVQNTYTVYELEDPLPSFNALYFAFRHHGQIFKLKIEVINQKFVYSLWTLSGDKFNNICHSRKLFEDDLLPLILPKINSDKLDILKMECIL